MINRHDDTVAVLFYDLHLYISARGVLRHGYA
jgi:hypothetical protein